LLITSLFLSYFTKNGSENHFGLRNTVIREIPLRALEKGGILKCHIKNVIIEDILFMFLVKTFDVFELCGAVSRGIFPKVTPK